MLSSIARFILLLILIVTLCIRELPRKKNYYVKGKPQDGIHLMSNNQYNDILKLYGKQHPIKNLSMGKATFHYSSPD